MRESAADVVVYGADWCPFTRLAHLLLAERQVPFQVVEVGDDPDFRSRLQDEFGRTTVPVIVVDGVVLGGYSELRALDSAGGIERGALLVPAAAAGR